MSTTRLCVVVATATLAMAPTHGWAQEKYGKWTFNADQRRHECSYTFETKDGKSSTQTVAAYTKDDKDRFGWAYYYSAEGKPWARCAVPGNSSFDDKVMYWQKLNAKGDGYGDFNPDSRRAKFGDKFA